MSAQACPAAPPPTMTTWPGLRAGAGFPGVSARVLPVTFTPAVLFDHVEARLSGKKAGAPTASPVSSEKRAWCQGQRISPSTTRALGERRAQVRAGAGQGTELPLVAHQHDGPHHSPARPGAGRERGSGCRYPGAKSGFGGWSSGPGLGLGLGLELAMALLPRRTGWRRQARARKPPPSVCTCASGSMRRVRTIASIGTAPPVSRALTIASMIITSARPSSPSGSTTLLFQNTVREILHPARRTDRCA